jgi:acyl carrier protein
MRPGVCSRSARARQSGKKHMNLIDSLQSIFREIFDDPDMRIRPSTSPNDIADWDSVAQVKIVLAVEEAFGARFTTGQVAEFHTVGDLLRGLEQVKA